MSCEQIIRLEYMMISLHAVIKILLTETTHLYLRSVDILSYAIVDN